MLSPTEVFADGVTVPSGMAAGRYTAQVVVSLANGTSAQAEVFDGDGERQHPTTARGVAAGRTDGGDTGHGRGPQDRGLEPGEQGEEPDDGQRDRQPMPELEAVEHRLGQHEHERHVLA